MKYLIMVTALIFSFSILGEEVSGGGEQDCAKLTNPTEQEKCCKRIIDTAARQAKEVRGETPLDKSKSRDTSGSTYKN